MANLAGLANQFKVDLLKGVHAFGTTNTRAGTGADSFKGALYTAASSLTGSALTTYGAATTEVSGTGYTAGGATITNATAPSFDTTKAIWTPSSPLQWTTVTLSTAFDSLLIYNDTVATKPAVGLFTFGSTTVNAGNFTINWPTNAAATALIQIA